MSLMIKGRRVAARLMKSRLATAWCPWCDFVSCQKQRRCKARTIVKRMVNVTLAHGFESWVLSLSLQEENPIQQSVSITMPVDFGMIAASEAAQQSFDEALKTQICASLDIPPGSVHVLCHQRGIFDELKVATRPRGTKAAGACGGGVLGRLLPPRPQATMSAHGISSRQK
jgi:hypothetical protein